MTHDEMTVTLDGMHKIDWLKALNALYAVSKLTQAYKDETENEDFNRGMKTGFRLVMDMIEKELRK